MGKFSQRSFCTVGLRRSLVAALCALAFAAALLVSSCASAGTPSSATPEIATALDAYPSASIEGYEGAQGYSEPSCFVDMTVRDVIAEMEKGTSFVVFCAYDNCPWCNGIITHLNDCARSYGMKIGYVNTRKNPAWQSNKDMDDYDLFATAFGSVLEKDDDGTPHLYVPHLFFVRNGVLVYDHAGTVPSQEEASNPLTEAQVGEFRTYYDEGMRAIMG